MEFSCWVQVKEKTLYVVQDLFVLQFCLHVNRFALNFHYRPVYEPSQAGP